MIRNLKRRIHSISTSNKNWSRGETFDGRIPNGHITTNRYLSDGIFATIDSARILLFSSTIGQPKRFACTRIWTKISLSWNIINVLLDEKSSIDIHPRHAWKINNLGLPIRWSSNSAMICFSTFKTLLLSFESHFNIFTYIDC